MKLASKILTGMMLCSVAACGSNSPAPGGTSTGTNGNNTVVDSNTTNGNTTQAGSMSVLTVSGTVSNFAFDTNAVTNDTNTLQVGVLDANSLYPNGTLAVISATPIKATDCTTTAGVRSCKFSIANVDTSKFTAGLLVVTTDSRVSGATGDATQWQTLATFVSRAALTAAQNSGTLANVAAYDETAAGHTALTNLAGTAASGLATTGAVIGLVTGSDGTTPVAGATITAGAASASAAGVTKVGAAPNAGSAVAEPNTTTAANPNAVAGTTPANPAASAGSIYYANADVTAGSATGPTSANGLFLAVPSSKTASALSASDTVTATGATGTWTVPTTPAVSPLWLVVNIASGK